MPIQFERVVTRYELTQHCVLLQDDAGADYSNHFKTEDVQVRINGRQYHGVVRDFYVGSKFKSGITLTKEHDDHDIFFEQSINSGRHLRISTDPANQSNGHQLVDVEVYLVTKPHA
jgi:hypothetical protein